jgi:phosphoglycolate phosphatase-like HAD superfamily hydrolase
VLMVFDVDGTLTLTGSLDAEAYARAFRSTFGAPLPGTDWARYRSPTDQGVAEEVVRHLGADPALIPEFRRRFLSDLGEKLGRRPAQPVPGAVEVFDSLAAAP